jgi:hypothetical protein
MDSSLYTVATAILALILVAVVYGFVLFFIFWIFWKIINYILCIKSVQILVSAIEKWVESWWKHYKIQLENIWEFISELIIEPLFFAYTIFVLFNKISSFTDYTKINPETNFLQMLNQDMNQDMNFYLFFMAIFFLWMLGKAWKHRKEESDQKVLVKILQDHDKLIQENTRVLIAIARKLDVPEPEITTNNTQTEGKELKSENKIDKDFMEGKI